MGEPLPHAPAPDVIPQLCFGGNRKTPTFKRKVKTFTYVIREVSHPYTCPPPPLSFPTPGKTVPHHPMGDGHQVTVPHPPLGDRTTTVHAGRRGSTWQ